MKCSKCGKPGFPVGVACLSCGAQVSAMPRVLNPQVEKDVFCEKCGKKVDDVKLFCLSCHTPFPRPFSFSGDGPLDPGFAEGIHWIEYFVEDSACEECKKFVGVKFEPKDIKKHAIPIPKCKRVVCFCSVVAY